MRNEKCRTNTAIETQRRECRHGKNSTQEKVELQQQIAQLTEGTSQIRNEILARKEQVSILAKLKSELEEKKTPCQKG